MQGSAQDRSFDAEPATGKPLDTRQIRDEFQSLNQSAHKPVFVGAVACIKVLTAIASGE